MTILHLVRVFRGGTGVKLLNAAFSLTLVSSPFQEMGYFFVPICEGIIYNFVIRVLRCCSYSAARDSDFVTTIFSRVMCCVCVFFPFILDIKFVGRTSRGHTGGRSHRISHPLSFCGACLNFSREKDSAIPFSRRP